MESTGGGESGAMCCDFWEIGKVERIFSIFSEKNSTNLSAGDLLMVASWLEVCVKHHQGLAIFLGVMMVILDLCFQKF